MAKFFTLEPKVDDPGPFFLSCVEALQTTKPFVYTKLNHGFWERLVHIQKLGIDITRIQASEIALIKKEATRRRVSGTGFVEDGFLTELLAILSGLPDPDSGFNFCASIDAYPFSHEIAGIPHENRFACLDLLRSHVSAAQLLNAEQRRISGYEFKAAFIAGRFPEFTNVLKQHPFMLIANETMSDFGTFIGAERMDHFHIHRSRARYDRKEILNGTLRRLDERRHLTRIVMQAGGSLSTWLCYHLFRARPDVQLFDLGGALVVCNPAIALRKSWVRVYLKSVLDSVESVSSTSSARWELMGSREETMGVSLAQAPMDRNLRNPQLVACASARGVASPDGRRDLQAPVSSSDDRASFVENKALDLRRVAQFQELSLAVNHHANHGPVSTLLEEAIGTLLDVPQGRKVIACSSCTSGLFLAASLLAYKAEKESLRWVTSAYSFFSSNIGPFANAHVIDCDEAGRFDLARMSEIPDEDWDGLVYTNLFAQHADWQDVRAYCEARGKFFVVDNAVGLLDRPADSHASGDVEAVSCHHTKPWGYGEGGFLIVNEPDEAIVRSLMNFGSVLPPRAHRHSVNAKISDLASAALLDRLERMSYWATFYRKQEQRIRSILVDHDLALEVLPGNTVAISPRAYLPLVAPHEVPVERLREGSVVMRKYYRPLRPGEARRNAPWESDSRAREMRQPFPMPRPCIHESCVVHAIRNCASSRPIAWSRRYGMLRMWPTDLKVEVRFAHDALFAKRMAESRPAVEAPNVTGHHPCPVRSRVIKVSSLVDFFVAGVQKGGTTALARFLAGHPEIQMSSVKELHFFDKDRAVSWDTPDYRRLHRSFDWSIPSVRRGEATPIYLYWPPALQRLRRYNPSAKLVIALRHPAFRAFSHWRMERSRNAESLSFDKAISEPARERVRRAPLGVHRVFSYVERGHYAEQIERLLSLFSREQVHFLRTDELWSHTADELGKLEAFLGIRQVLGADATQEYIVPVESAELGGMSSETRARLTMQFADDIRRTAALTGLSLDDWLDEGYREPMAPPIGPGALSQLQR